MTLRSDERGVTSPMEYVFTFAIAAILVTGLIIAATNAAGNQRTRTVEAQMEVVANQVAGSLETADRTVQMVEDVPGTLEIEYELPENIVENHYNVEISSSGGTTSVAVTSSLADDPVTVTADTVTGVTDSTVVGGDITVIYNGAGELEVTK